MQKCRIKMKKIHRFGYGLKIYFLCDILEFYVLAARVLSILLLLITVLPNQRLEELKCKNKKFGFFVNIYIISCIDNSIIK